MEIALYDKKVLTIQNELENKKRDIKHNFREIKNMAKSNKFLKDIVEDYKKYYKYIVQEKRREEEYLRMLSNYMDTLILEEKDTEEILHHSNKEQKRIMSELSKIRHEINEITELTSEDAD